MSKPVTYAQVHAGFFIPGLPQGGNIKTTLPPDSTKLKNLKMTRLDSGELYMEWEEGNFVKSYTVAAANIVGMLHPPIKKDAV